MREAIPLFKHPKRVTCRAKRLNCAVAAQDERRRVAAIDPAQAVRLGVVGAQKQRRIARGRRALLEQVIH